MKMKMPRCRWQGGRVRKLGVIDVASDFYLVCLLS